MESTKNTELVEEINRRSIAVIQARMGSKRFPGKVMYPLSGRPAIGHLLDSVRQVYDRENLYVVTSLDPANDVLVAFCRKNGYHVYRGDEQNVASRFRDILEMRQAEFFIRLNADSPLLDSGIIMQAAEMALTGHADIVSTKGGKGVPSGMNVEVVRSEIFLKAYGDFTDAGHFEHVTAYFYENAQRFTAISVSPDIGDPHLYKFSFDTDDDRRRIERLFAALPLPHYTYTLREKCRVYADLFGGGTGC